MKKLIFILLGLLAIGTGVSEAINMEVFESTGSLEVMAATGSLTFMTNERTRAVQKALRGIGDLHTEISQLVVEQVLSDTDTEYTFDFSSNAKDSKKPAQILLPSGDVFIICAYGLFLQEKNTDNPKSLKEGHYQTYVNAAYWTAGTDFNAAHLNQVYAGSLKYQVGASTQFDKQPLSEHLVIPETQFDGAGVYDSINGSEAGYILSPSIIAVDAEADAKFIVSLPSISSPKWAHDLTKTESVLVMRVKGIKVRAGSNKYNEIMKAMQSVSV
jgi:hypothetical protein